MGGCDRSSSLEVGDLVRSPWVGGVAEMVADDVAGMGFMSAVWAKQLSHLMPCKPGIIEFVVQVLMGITIPSAHEGAGITSNYFRFLPRL